jgi:hypothetical protein
MKKLLSILLVASSIYAGVTKDGDIVTDNDTSLIWEDGSTIAKKNWSEAISYCESLELGGYDDWRLPNKNELLSIVDYSKISPAIKDGFVNT